MCFSNYYANKKYDWKYQTKILICLKQSSSLFDSPLSKNKTLWGHKTFHKWLHKITIKFGEHETAIFKISVPIVVQY